MFFSVLKSPLHQRIFYNKRVRGVEPLSTGWKPVVMPLYDTRKLLFCAILFSSLIIYEFSRANQGFDFYMNYGILESNANF